VQGRIGGKGGYAMKVAKLRIKTIIKG